MTGLLAAVLDLLYPPRCPVCRQPVPAHGALCPRCLAAVAPGPRHINVRGHGCRFLDACLAVADYAGPVKRLLHDLKFRAARQRAPYLTQLLLTHVPPAYAAADLAVAVPLYPARQRQRGFNQTELLFAPLLAHYRLAAPPHVLARTRDTAPQWTLDKRARRQNITGAFAVQDGAPVADRDILLLDDIFTTGLTLDECAGALKQRGARRVRGLVLATGARDVW